MSRRDKGTVINLMIDSAADIMEAKAEYNEMVAEQLADKGDTMRAERLREMNKRITAAVELIRENAGCWN